MKHLKHFFITLLLLCSVTASAYDFDSGGIFYNITDATNKTVAVTYYKNHGENANFYRGDVVIPKSVTYNGNTYSVTSIGDYAFVNCHTTSITIPNSVTSIGKFVFNNCTELTAVHISDLVAWYGIDYARYDSNPLHYAHNLYLNGELVVADIELNMPEGLTKIGSYAFYGRTELTSITIPNSVTSIGKSAFENCTGLTSVEFNAENCTCSSPVFSGCTALSTVTIGENVKAIPAYAFAQCTGLKSITIPNSVTSIGRSAFYDCPNLRSLTIGSGVLSIGATMFSEKPTKVIFLGNTPPSGVGGAKGSVNYVSSATNYGFGTEYTNLSSMFEVGGVKYVLVSAKDRTCDVIDCNYNNPVEDIVIDSLVTYRNVKLKVRNVNDYALYDNDYAKSATIKNNGYIGSYAFANCNSMQNATIGNSVEDIKTYAFSECTVLEEIVIPDNVPSMGSYCFYNCSSLEKAFIGTGIELLNTKIFSGCSSLNEVKIGENVSTIDTYVFENCSLLPQVNIPQATKKINDNVFNGCTNLANVIIENRTDSLVLGCKNLSSSYYPLFADCGLDSVYIGGKLQYSKTSSYGYSPFRGNKSLRSVTYNDVEVAIYDREFENCSNLQNIVFGKGISSIGNFAFRNCTSLPSITIPDEVMRMGNSCFATCTAMKSAKVGTGVKTLEWYSFGGCSALTDMQIGVNVDSIGRSVFRECTSLPSINIPQATKVINDSVFYNCTSLADVIIEDRTTTLKLGSNGYSSSSSAAASTNPLFYSCPLDSVYIGGKISYKTETEYGFSPFFRNTSLRTVVVSDTETLVYDNEFYGCTGLTDVVIGDGVTAIGNWAFSGCVGLVNFSFGNSVETIGAEAFSDCTSMVKIVSSCNVPPVCGDQALADINVWDCTLYVPNDYIDAYYSAPQWWDFFFIDGAEYTITFMIGDEKYSEATIKYGAEITLPTPTKVGYTFMGWENVPAVMPADNIVVYGSFKANDYIITYIVDGEVYETVTVACDAVIEPIEAPEKDGYTFNAWEGLPETMPAGNVEVVAVYNEIPTEITITIGKYGSTVFSSEYALDFSEVDGLKAYAATGYNTNSGVITMTRVQTSNAGVGLYMTAEPGTYVVPVIDYSDDNSLNMLVGNLEQSTVNAISADGIYANYKYTIKSGDTTPKFYQYADGSSISAGKAYLQIPLDWIGTNASKSIEIRFDEGKTTDIDELKGENEGEKTIYDLQGRKLESHSNGMYIINGKKVLINN